MAGPVHENPSPPEPVKIKFLVSQIGALFVASGVGKGLIVTDLVVVAEQFPAVAVTV